MRFLKFVILATTLGLVSCGEQQPATESVKSEKATPPAVPGSNLDQRGTDNLLSLLSSYYELKDALVATDAQKADIAASHVLSAAETMRHELGNTNEPIRVLLDSVMTKSEAIVNTKDETCDKKRVTFETVGDQIFSIAQQAGLKNGHVYRQFCPMAFNDKGAHWISNEEEIRNPYLPKTMLHCGEVQDSL